MIPIHQRRDIILNVSAGNLNDEDWLLCKLYLRCGKASKISVDDKSMLSAFFYLNKLTNTSHYFKCFQIY